MNLNVNTSVWAEENLARARAVYGDKNQIIVSIEECCELAAILAKFARYHNSETAVQELKPQVLDEVADVLIVLDHVTNIFEISDEEVKSRIMTKVERLQRWLQESNEFEQTTRDRKV